MRTRTKLLTVVVVVAVVVAAGFLVRQLFFKPTTITAYFPTATAIYPGDEVRVSGVKVGSIKAIDPEGQQTRLTLEVDPGVSVPAQAKAIIVAPNLVAARFVQLTPPFRDGDSDAMADGAVIPEERTAIPVEWDQVKTQLERLASELGPQSGVDGTSVSRFIDSAANAMDGNGAKLRETLAQLSGVARVMADGSGDIVDIIRNLHVFVDAVRGSSEQIVMFENRLATLTSVVNDSRSSLDAMLNDLSVAIDDVQRFVAGTRAETSEQVTRLSNVMQNLVDSRMSIENILHITPTAIANTLNMYNVSSGTPLGSFAFANFSNPVQAVCGMIGAVENTTAPETAKLCEQYFGPALRLLNFNGFPFPINPYLTKSASPDKLIYSDMRLAPNGGGIPRPPEPPPTVSAYTGAGDVPPPPGWNAPPAPGRGAYAPNGLPATPHAPLLPGAPQPSPTTFDGMLLPGYGGPPPGPAPGPAPDAPLLPAEGTPPA
ncbi:MCE family protein [Mycolicibacterium bacteremicum]|uniref:MCE family protein n=1 Tax=Mycolicibacterium bacteremicum TaxID=564198 RepID=UPI0026EDDDA6|nr:MCE family protein [Mycolicibacterium bacteremicum]